MHKDSLPFRAKDRMRELHLRQVDVAHKLGVTQATVSRWLSGGGITEENIRDLAMVLFVPSEWLKSGVGELPPAPKVGEGQIFRPVIVSESKSPFGDRLRFARKRYGRSISEFSKRIGTDKGYWSRLERGLAENPSMSLILKIADVCNLSPGWLLTGQGEPNHGGLVGKAIESRDQFERDYCFIEALLLISKKMSKAELEEVASDLGLMRSFPEYARDFWHGLLKRVLSYRFPDK